MGQPSVDVLAHGGQDETKEPPVTASGFGCKQVEVVLLALDRTFGTGTGILMAMPQDRVSGNEGVEAVIFFGVGVDDPAVG